MSLVYDLQVYKDSYSLLINVFDVVKNFRREYKYTLGDKLKTEILEAMLCIYRANVSNDKSYNIQKAREHIELLKILLRLCKDLRLMSIEKHGLLMKTTEEISKQLTQWQKWSEKQKST